MFLTVVCNFGKNEEIHNCLPDYEEKTTSLTSEIEINLLLGQSMPYNFGEYWTLLYVSKISKVIK